MDMMLEDMVLEDLEKYTLNEWDKSFSVSNPEFKMYAIKEFWRSKGIWTE